jgi:hypothetical protein
MGPSPDCRIRFIKIQKDLFKSEVKVESSLIFTVDFFQNSLCLKKLMVLEMSKRAILANKWGFERSLLLIRFLNQG